MVSYVYIVDEILGDGVLDDIIIEIKDTEQDARYLEILRYLSNKNIAPADAKNELLFYFSTTRMLNSQPQYC